MRRLITLLLFCLLWTCSNNSEKHISNLSGYWEIQDVTFPNGEKKEYTINETIDYIEVTDSVSGFRKKLKASLFGDFQASQDQETFSIRIENDSLNIYYKTAFSAWKETVLLANENELLVVNANKVRYHYKRYKPLDLE